MNKSIKVTNINTPYQIVLNVGIDDGITPTTRFVVYTLGPMAVDPDTKEELEQIEIVRGKGKVVHLQNKICTIESTDTSEMPTTKKRVISRPVFAASWTTPSEEIETTREKLPFKEVQVGDLARII